MTTTRPQLHLDFVQAFHRGKAPLPVGAAELDAAEKSLRILFPESLRHLLLTHGVLSTPFLPQIETAPNRFLKPGELLLSSQAMWQGGAPEKLVAFAADQNHDWYCFERTEAASRPDDGVVWHYAPETGGHTLSVAFDEWLQELLQFAFQRDEDEDPVWDRFEDR